MARCLGCHCVYWPQTTPQSSASSVMQLRPTWLSDWRGGTPTKRSRWHAPQAKSVPGSQVTSIGQNRRAAPPLPRRAVELAYACDGPYGGATASQAPAMPDATPPVPEKPLCFVISPIGARGSDTRTHPDWLRNGIIELFNPPEATIQRGHRPGCRCTCRLPSENRCNAM
jgi:hypothetical protein